MSPANRAIATVARVEESAGVIPWLVGLRERVALRSPELVGHVEQTIEIAKEFSILPKSGAPHPADRWDRLSSQLRIVLEAARSFGRTHFTLSELCDRVNALFPNPSLDRMIVSRRLYDLQHGRRPKIVRVDAAAKNSLPMKRLYQNQTPP